MTQVKEVPADTPQKQAARAMVERMKRLGERCAVQADAKPEIGDATQGDACMPKVSGQPGSQKTVSHGPTPRDQAFGAKLAEILDDFASLNFYIHLAGQLRVGALLSDRSAPQRRDYVFAKARQLAARRIPQGPIRNPAACFVGWVKGLG